MGEDGYTAVAERLMKVTQAMRDGIGKITVRIRSFHMYMYTYFDCMFTALCM